MKDVKWEEYLSAAEMFSAANEEPEWMLELRKEALSRLGELALPLIERVKIDRWPLLTPEFGYHIPEEAAVVDFENIENYPYLVEQEGLATFEQLPAHLAEQGVIFTDLFQALRDYPDLVEKAYGKAVPFDEDKLTAFHTAFLNRGAFLYVPRGVVVEEPFDATFLFDSDASETAVHHVLIVAEENSEFTYIEKLKVHNTGKNEKRSVNIITEVIAKAGARIKYAAVDQLGSEMTAYINRRGAIGRDAMVHWAIGAMNDGNVIADFDSDLNEEGAHAEVNVVAISSGKQTQGIDTRVTNKAPHSIGHILQHGAIRESGTLTFNGIGHIWKGAKGADAQQESRVLMLSDKARGDANPILLIDENDVTAGHAASIGQVDAEEMYYMMSRGLHKSEAERLVIRGFLSSVLVAIPVNSVRQEFIEVLEGKLSEA